MVCLIQQDASALRVLNPNQIDSWNTAEAA
jgi:hypothetical protein